MRAIIAVGLLALAPRAHAGVGVSSTDDRPVAAAPVGISIHYLWRWPCRELCGDGDLQYEGGTGGPGLGLALPFGANRSLYFTMSATRLSALDGQFGGYRVAPIGFGYWRRWNDAARVSFDLGGSVTVLQIEQMAGATDAYPTQPSVALGYGALLYGGGHLTCGPVVLAAGLQLGVDARYLSLQTAGFTTGASRAFAFGWVVAPTLTLQLAP